MRKINLRQFVVILQARRMLIAWCLLIVVGITVLLDSVLPPQYVASTDVVIDVKSPDPVAGVIYPALAMPEYMATQIDIINSDRVAQRVITLLRLDQQPSSVHRWQVATDGEGDIRTWLSAKLKKHLSIKPSHQGNVVTLTYRSDDPAEAATIANAFAQAYIDTNLELRVDPAVRNAQWFKGQVGSMREDLGRAQERLAEFQRQNGIIDGVGEGDSNRVDIEVAKLNDLSNQLNEAHSQAMDSQSKQHFQSESGASLPEVMSNPLIQNLRESIAENEAQLSQLGATLGSSHPEYKRLLAQTVERKDQLQAQIDRVTDSINLSRRLGEAKEITLRQQIEDQKKKILELNERRAQMAMLQRDVDSAQKAYDAVAQRFSETSLESQTTVTNIAVLTPASPPLRPSSPAVVRNLILAVLLGLNVGVALAIGLELMHRRIRSQEDVSALLGVPLLVELRQARVARPARKLFFRSVLGGRSG